MLSYILKRLLLMIPTLFGILLLTFAVIQFVPGGPVEQMVAQLQGRDSGGEGAAASGAGYRGRQGVDAARIEEIKQLYGFDKPAHERFLQMLGQFARFDLGAAWTSADNRWTVNVFARNLTDRKVLSSLAAVAPLLGSVRVASLEPPRHFGIGLERRF